MIFDMKVAELKFCFGHELWPKALLEVKQFLLVEKLRGSHL